MTSNIMSAILVGVLPIVPCAFAADHTVTPVSAVTATHTGADKACADKVAPFKSPNGVVVTPGILDMGRMMDAEARKIQFELTNSNTQAVKVLRVRAGCSCTKVTDFPKELIPPGGKVTVTLEVLGEKLPRGDFQRTALVEFDGLTPPTVPLKYTGAKTEPIMIRPRATVKLGKLAGPTTGWTRTFEIVGNLEDGKPLTLGDPVCPPFLKAEIKAVKVSQYQLTVTQTGTRGWGTFRDRVLVPVKSPAGFSNIMFSFSGQVGERLQARPVFFWFPLAATVKKDAVVLRKVKIGTNKGKPVISVKDVKAVFPPGVKVSSMAQEGAFVAVELKFEPEFFVKERRERLSFVTPVGQAVFLVAVGGESPMSLRKSSTNDDVTTAEGDGETSDEAPRGDIGKKESAAAR